jgi:hypothetical protein
MEGFFLSAKSLCTESVNIQDLLLNRLEEFSLFMMFGCSTFY